MIPIPEFAFRLVGSLVFGSIAIALRGAADVASECGADWLSEYVKTGLLDRLEKHLTGSGKMLNHDVERAVFNALTRSILDISQSYNLVADRAKGRSDFIDGLEQILRQENLNFLVDLDQKQLVELIHGKEEDILASMLRRFDQAVVAHEGEGAWEFTERFQVRDETFRREFAQHFPQKLRFYFVEELKDNQRAWVGFMHFMLTQLSSDLVEMAETQKDLSAHQSVLNHELLKIQTLLDRLAASHPPISETREALVKEINALKYLRAFFSDALHGLIAGQSQIQNVVMDLDQKVLRRAHIPRPEDLVYPFPQSLDDFLPLLHFRTPVTGWYGSESQKEDIIQWIIKPLEEPGLALIYEEGGVGKSRLAIQLCLEMMALNWWANLTDPTKEMDFDYPVEGFLLIIDYPEEKIDAVNKFLYEIFNSRPNKPVKIILLSRREDAWWEFPGRIQAKSVRGHKLVPFRLERIGQDNVIPMFREACYNLCRRYQKPIPQLDEDRLNQFFFGSDEAKQVYSKPLFVLMAAIHAVLSGDYSLSLRHEGILKDFFKREREHIQSAAISVGLNEEACCRAVALAALTGELGRGELELLGRNESLFFGLEMKPSFFDQFNKLPFSRKGKIDALKPDVFAAVFLVEELTLAADNGLPVSAWVWEVLKNKIQSPSSTPLGAGKLPLPGSVNLADGIARLVYDSVVVFGDAAHSLLYWLEELIQDKTIALAFEPFTKDHRPSPYLRHFLLAIDKHLVSLETPEIPLRAERLTNYAFHLFWQDEKKAEVAHEAATEATSLWRELYAVDSEKYGLNLVHALEIYSLSAANATDALAANREAIAISHKIHKSRNNFESADRLGQALKEAVNRLRDTQEFKKALKLSNLAVALYTSILSTAGQASHQDKHKLNDFRNSLARILHNRALTYSDMGMTSEALQGLFDAMTLRRQVVQDNPWRYEPEFALTLEQYSRAIDRNGDPVEALIILEECLQVKQRLLKANPAKNLISLLNLKFYRGTLLEKNGRTGELDQNLFKEFEVVKSHLERNTLEFTQGDIWSLINIGYQGSQGTLRQLAIETNNLTIKYLQKIRSDLSDKGLWNGEHDIGIAAALLNQGNAMRRQHGPAEAIECYSQALEIVEKIVTDDKNLIVQSSIVKSLSLANRALESLKTPTREFTLPDTRNSLKNDSSLREFLKNEWPTGYHKDLIVSYDTLASKLETEYTEVALLVYEYNMELCGELVKKGSMAHVATAIELKFSYAQSLLKSARIDAAAALIVTLVPEADEWIQSNHHGLAPMEMAWKKNAFSCHLINMAEKQIACDAGLIVAQRWMEEALENAREAKDHYALGYMLDTLGHLQLICGERSAGSRFLLEEARKNFELSMDFLVPDKYEKALQEVRQNHERVLKSLEKYSN